MTRNSLLSEFELTDPIYCRPIPPDYDLGPRITGQVPPRGWVRYNFGIWTLYSRESSESMPQSGWKVHVSSPLDRASVILDRVSSICIELGISFKHIRSTGFYIYANHKYADRAMSGKFCCLYPASQEAAREAMSRLQDQLMDEEGPTIFSDRPFLGSRSIYYRYGAFTPQFKMLQNGYRTPLLNVGSETMSDRREARFIVPPGVDDPFSEDGTAAAGQPDSSTLAVYGYSLVGAVRRSNAGGLYLAKRTGGSADEEVIVKVARPHAGYDWNGVDACRRLKQEYETLRIISAINPAICAAPLDFIEHQHHSYLIMSRTPGRSLYKWTLANNPLIGSPASLKQAEPIANYFQECLAYLGQLQRVLEMLHGAGWRHGDLSPDNVILGPENSVSLVDFECASRVTDPPSTGLATDGFVPNGGVDMLDTFSPDGYGLAATAATLIFPFFRISQLSRQSVLLLRRDIEQICQIPDALWELAYKETVQSRPQISPPRPGQADEAKTDTRQRELLDGIASDLVEMANLNPAIQAYHWSKRAYWSNMCCFAYGIAGIVHALYLAGYGVPDVLRDALLRQFDDAANRSVELPPGLFTGWAGLAVVCAEIGAFDYAERALDLSMEAERSVDIDDSLAFGRSGVAVAYLRVGKLMKDQRRIDLAHRTGQLLMASKASLNLSGRFQDNLFLGRSGVALALHHLFKDSNDEQYLDAQRTILQTALGALVRVSPDVFSAPADGPQVRLLPYLAEGSAGILAAAVRYRRNSQSDEFDEVLAKLAADVCKPVCLEAGICQGQAGLGFAARDAEDWGFWPQQMRYRPLELADHIEKHAIKTRSGIRFLGEAGTRYCSDIWSGSSGVLTALTRTTGGLGGQLLVFDVPG
jgi:serine/threonine protein kinase